jgi:hypothetical protein
MRGHVHLQKMRTVLFLLSLSARFKALTQSIFFFVLTSFTTLVTPVTAASELPAKVPNEINQTVINQLNPKECQEIFDQLQANYVETQTLPSSQKQPDATTVTKILSQLKIGVELRENNTVAAPVRPFRSEILSDHFGYIRFGTLNSQSVIDLDATLNRFINQPIFGVILDLRTTNFSQDYQLTLEIASCFTPVKTPLFRLSSPRTGENHVFQTGTTPPLFTGPVVILTDHSTQGASELLGAVLKKQVHALIFGKTTPGKTAEYRSFPIGSKYQLLVATAEAIVPDASQIFATGLVPDIVTPQSQEELNRILYLTDSQSVVPFITEIEPPKTNEAALIAGKNPDLDAIEAQEEGRTPPEHLIDATLQRAMDFLVTLRFFKQ